MGAWDDAQRGGVAGNVIADRRSRALHARFVLWYVWATLLRDLHLDCNANGEGGPSLASVDLSRSLGSPRGCSHLEPDFMEVCKAAWLRY